MRFAAERNNKDVAQDRASAASKCFGSQLLSSFSSRRASSESKSPALEPTSSERRSESLADAPKDLSTVDTQSTKETFLYLAYGSNLSDETFLGKRGIKPLSATNVLVPELRMTFDLPGIPYTEPCFANSAKRDPRGHGEPASSHAVVSEKAPLLHEHKEYNKDKWKKGMVGVVYEVTAADFAHIIATEGGGSSYQDVLVDCHALDADQSVPVPWTPKNESFKAHTLFAPAVPDGEEPPKDGGRFRRPDPSYAQASARYLKLITDGAAERKLPYEYQDYLHSLQPYTITTQKQHLGQFVFGMLWVPIIMFIFSLNRQFQDDKGIAPAWLRLLTAGVFRAVWGSYDYFFRALFGDGERTTDEKDERVLFQHKKSEAASRRVVASDMTGDDEKPSIIQ
ncbi:hypothetical protein MBLNU457_1907t1 [Dothideomycetes sp. NU457]